MDTNITAKGKQIPILFSTPMVQAIIAGRKTVTRRIIKPQPDARGLRTTNVLFEDFHGRETKCPYGKLGDLLWVKETHYAFGHWQYQGLTKTGKLKKEFVHDGDPEHYCFDKTVKTRHGLFVLPVEPATSMLPGWYKRPSLFLPKTAARIWLRNEGVKVERLQDISEEQAKLEGIACIENNFGNGPAYMDYLMDDPRDTFKWYSIATLSFKSLWKKINGPQSWDANPWVWAVNFKVVSTTGKPT